MGMAMSPRSESRDASGENQIGLTLWQQVWRRRKTLLATWQPYVSAVAAAAAAYGASVLPSSSMTISSVAAIGFAYASITVAACVSAVVLSLGLPGADRLRKWARHGATADKSALSELVFVLVWACIWQLLVIVACVLALLFGGDGPIYPPGASIVHAIGLTFGLWVFFYALFELFVIVETLWQIGAVIIAEERASDDSVISPDGSDPKFVASEGENARQTGLSAWSKWWHRRPHRPR